MKDMVKTIRVAVGITDNGWDERFVNALEDESEKGYPLSYDRINLDGSDWINKVKPFDMVIWKPDDMEALKALRFKERIYIMEKHLGKLVVPNFNTIWHFESKIAQSYLFEIEKVPTPKTTVSHDQHDAARLLQSLDLPLVFKQSEGASSKNVQLVHSRRAAKKLFDEAFCGRMYREARLDRGPRWKAILKLARKPWFWRFVWHYLLNKEPTGCLYFQEFMPNNDSDLRITVIGDRYAYGFWRNNRKGDFRASGSGNIDFQRPVPEEPLRYCMELNRRFDFDSMAYDILFDGNRFVVTEMSYAYVDWAPQKTAGYHLLLDNRQLEFVEGHVWPQTLWVAWALQRAQHFFDKQVVDD